MVLAVGFEDVLAQDVAAGVHDHFVNTVYVRDFICKLLLFLEYRFEINFGYVTEHVSDAGIHGVRRSCVEEGVHPFNFVNHDRVLEYRGRGFRDPEFTKGRYTTARYVSVLPARVYFLLVLNEVRVMNSTPFYLPRLPTERAVTIGAPHLGTPVRFVNDVSTLRTGF